VYIYLHTVSSSYMLVFDNNRVIRYTGGDDVKGGVGRA